LQTKYAVLIDLPVHLEFILNIKDKYH